MFRRVSARLAPAATARAFRPAFTPKRAAFAAGAFVTGAATVTGCAATAFCFWSSPAPAVQAPFDFAGVKKDLEALLEDDLSLAPVLVRLAWHSAGSFDAGCPGQNYANKGAMRFAPECMHGANAGLQVARDLLEPFKLKYGPISYADLWSLAGCVAVEAMGGPAIPWRFGRTDVTEAKHCAVDGRLPDAAQTQDHVRAVFTRMGFNDQETVALIGAHAVGECHADRSGFVGPWTHDKLGFGNTFFSTLLDEEWVVNADAKQLQFKDKATGRLMMLPADIAFLIDPVYRKHVEAYAKDGDLFNKDFACAFQKLLELGTENLATPKA